MLKTSGRKRSASKGTAGRIASTRRSHGAMGHRCRCVRAAYMSETCGPNMSGADVIGMEAADAADRAHMPEVGRARLS
jgi:hypothetical protein